MSLDRSYIIGKAVVASWPIQDLGFITHITPYTGRPALLV
jgi:hypothetical protein